MFFGRGLALTALGLVVGLPISIAVTHMIAGALRWPLASSPLLGVAIGAITIIVAAIAVWIPSRRASAVDPLIAMRAE
jgi:ABC-type antimicrobial peptide transport system permease subunit